MNRLTIINFINPNWFKQITEFLCEHPNYVKLIPIVALDEYPNGFDKNPHESDENVPLNIFETLIYGLAYANVDIDYGKIQYLLLIKHLRQFKVLTKNMDFPEETQPEKVRTYRELINTIIDNNIVVSEFKYEQLHLIENVWGMTESTITLLHLLYDVVTTDRCLPYGDKQFKRGMSMFYDLENPTKEELKEITNTWTNKKVGLMFVIQFAHYSDFLI